VRNSEYVVTMSAREYIHSDAEIHLNHSHVPTKEDILNILVAS
jgi:hypothetical protein